MKRVASPTMQALNTFYGGKRCVVTSDVGSTVDYHHLDETNTNSSFENLIPLERGLNQAIETHRVRRHSGRRRTGASLPDRLTSRHLLTVMQSHLVSGHYPGAYGCARLASFIAANHEDDLDGCVRCATEAIYSVRPTGHLCLAADTLTRNVLSIARLHLRAISYSTLTGLIKEVGCYHLVYKDYRSFSEWKDLGRRLLFGSENRSDLVTGVRIDQHEAFLHLKKNRLSEGRDLLERTTDKMNSISYNAGPANNLQHLLAAYIVLDDLDSADDTLEKIEEKIGKVEPLSLIEIRGGGQVYEGRSTYWTQQGLILRRADLLLSTGREKEAFEYADNARSIRELCGIRHEGMLPSEALERFIQKYGIKLQKICAYCQATEKTFFERSAELLSTVREFVPSKDST